MVPERPGGANRDSLRQQGALEVSHASAFGHFFPQNAPVPYTFCNAMIYYYIIPY